MKQPNDQVSSVFSQIKTFNGYTDGVRIMANLHSRKTSCLVDFQAFRAFLQKETGKYELTKSGEFYHNFQQEGFAAIDCFNRSHISVRTFPGINDVVFDLFLSNDLPDNKLMSEHIYQRTIEFFESRVVQENIRITS